MTPSPCRRNLLSFFTKLSLYTALPPNLLNRSWNTFYISSFALGLFPSIFPCIGSTKTPRNWTCHWWLSEGVLEVKSGFLHWCFYTRNICSRIFLKDFLRKEILQLANNIIKAACTNFQFTFLTTRQQTFMWQVLKMSVLWDSYFRSENCKQLCWEASLSLPYLHVFTYLLTYLLTHLLKLTYSTYLILTLYLSTLMLGTLLLWLTLLSITETHVWNGRTWLLIEIEHKSV